LTLAIMRIVIALCLFAFLVLVTATQDDVESGLRRVERESVAEAGQQNKGRKNRKSKKRKSKKARKMNKNKNKKNKNRKNKKSRRVGKFRGLEKGRQAPQFGTGCQYVNLLEILSKGNDCSNGKKFVLKGQNARRQFLIVEDKVILAYVNIGTKFTACTSFEDVTSGVNCKVVDGLSNVNLEGSSQASTTTTTSTSTSTTATTAAATTGTTTVSTTTSTTTTTSTASSTTASANTTAVTSTAAPTTGSSFRCGVKKAGTRIVGGQETEVQEYPWLVAIGQPSGAWYGCGGTLVGKEWVISAAHCFVGVSASQLTVILGDHNLYVSGDGNRQVIGVSQLINHPQYVQATFQNDLSLLKLASNADLNLYTPACLPTQGQSFVGKTAFAYGWGTIFFGGFVSPVALDVDVPVVDSSTCNTAMGGIILDGMLCAGGVEGKDACQGDSGGPLSTPDDTTQQHFLIGATSFGDGCAQAGKYGVYADIAFFRTFIQEQFDANGGISLTP